MYMKILLLFAKAKSLMREDSNSNLVLLIICCKEFSAGVNFVLLEVASRVVPTLSSYSVNAI